MVNKNESVEVGREIHFKVSVSVSVTSGCYDSIGIFLSYSLPPAKLIASVVEISI